MAGLDNITKKIVDTAYEEADAVKKQAEQQAAEIIAKAKAEANDAKKCIIDEGEKKAAGIKKSAESFCVLDEKNELLKAKMQLIEEVFNSSIEKLKKLDTDEYFNVIKRLIDAFALTGTGELILSSADKKRMPSGFMNYVKAILDDRKIVTLSDDVDDSIDGGCILRYNDIEINCSFDAQLSSEKERLIDAVNAMLFN